MDVLSFAQQNFQLHKEGSFSYRAACPVCGSASGFVLARDTQRPEKGWRFWLNCCGDRRGGDAGDLAKLLNIPFSPSGECIKQSVKSEAPAFDASYWHKLLCGTRRNLSPDSEGGAYLLGRGIQPATWAKFGLGFGHRAGQPALLIPWFVGGHLKGGRYRLLHPESKQQRYAWWRGSECHDRLFGGHTHQQRRTLFIVEGELNAMSIYQVAADAVDVLSTGSENATVPTSVRWADSWDRVYYWFDKVERANAWGTALHGRTVTPDVDANELLQAGELIDLLRYMGIATV